MAQVKKRLLSLSQSFFPKSRTKVVILENDEQQLSVRSSLCSAAGGNLHITDD